MRAPSTASASPTLCPKPSRRACNFPKRCWSISTFPWDWSSPPSTRSATNFAGFWWRRARPSARAGAEESRSRDLEKRIVEGQRLFQVDPEIIAAPARDDRRQPAAAEKHLDRLRVDDGRPAEQPEAVARDVDQSRVELSALEGEPAGSVDGDARTLPSLLEGGRVDHAGGIDVAEVAPRRAPEKLSNDVAVVEVIWVQASARDGFHVAQRLGGGERGLAHRRHEARQVIELRPGLGGGGHEGADPRLDKGEIGVEFVELAFQRAR